jgi:hypothetical protein
MAGDWIKIRTELINDLDVMDICEATALDEYEVVGRLVKLWGWANHNTTDGYLRKMTPARLDKFVNHVGFASALLDAGWLVESKDGMTIPNWQKHNGSGAKVRAEAAARQAASRSRHRSVTESCDRSVTPVTDSCDKSVTRQDQEQSKRRTPSAPRQEAASGGAADAGGVSLDSGWEERRAYFSRKPEWWPSKPWLSDRAVKELATLSACVPWEEAKTMMYDVRRQLPTLTNPAGYLVKAFRTARAEKVA